MSSLHRKISIFCSMQRGPLFAGNYNFRMIGGMIQWPFRGYMQVSQFVIMCKCNKLTIGTLILISRENGGRGSILGIIIQSTGDCQWVRRLTTG